MNKTKRIALLGMLYAVAIVLSILEGWVVPLFGLPPGVKLGLSNVAVMYALFFIGWKEAYLLGVLKAFGVFITRGAVGAALSLAGGLLSITVMLLLAKLPQKWNISYFFIAVAGSLAHNLGQLGMVSLMLGTAFSFYYLPVLLLSGLVMGMLTGTSLRYLLPALKRITGN